MVDKLSEKLNEEKGEQLIRRVSEAINDKILNLSDWMKIYDILLEAYERERADTAEQIMIDSINGGDAEC